MSHWPYYHHLSMRFLFQTTKILWVVENRNRSEYINKPLVENILYHPISLEGLIENWSCTILKVGKFLYLFWSKRSRRLIISGIDAPYKTSKGQNLATRPFQKMYWFIMPRHVKTRQAWKTTLAEIKQLNNGTFMTHPHQLPDLGLFNSAEHW